ncbi:ATP-binding protein [Erythrobacter mangrovi]|uniref:histidine kinase n=1 Tax=Erythrobacter mangrovi TaxID=2739433 RepID=A0A7D3XQV0_9SPHN|nr:ATP-binding protein [Erythrobacter mangrovi]QKG70731.1 HAMP domain-containing protein [Erythrobacter mangrovi]
MQLIPRSLFGQVMLTLVAALLIAQAISTTLLYRAAEQRRELGIVHAMAFQLLSGAERHGREAMGDRYSHHSRSPRTDRIQDPPLPRLPRELRYSEGATTPLAPGDKRHPKREEALSQLLASQGIAVAEVVVISRSALEDPEIQRMAEHHPLAHRRFMGSPFDLAIAGLRQDGSGTWQVARLPVASRDRTIVRTLMLQTLILFLVLVGLLYFVLRRITRPLAALAERTQRFGGAGSPEEPLAVTGPDDVKRLIEAHNAMQARIGSMLDEKDVMLGAIGHDLKTPLAALRVRIESVEDDAARTKMAGTIEDITQTLDEILALARIGRNNSIAEPTELGALAASVVEEFEDMGEPVTLSTAGRIAAPVHLTWLKRGLRNLVTNALRYAGSAHVAVLREGDWAILRVDDDGPGIPDDRIAEMCQPFTRGETSRNRETGGAGLGLTLARAVAEQHGGTLVLANRPEGGLRAELRIPLGR